MSSRKLMSNPVASDLNFPRFSLGTAQFGIPSYGIANRVGQPPYEALREIVRKAFESGVVGLDTAAEYGESENLRGRILEELRLKKAAFVCSKISHLETTEDGSFVRKSVIRSLRRLRLETLSLCLLHRAQHLGYTDALISLKEEGLIRYAGVSVYTPAQAIEAIETPGIDALQHPLSLLDQRFARSGILQLARSRGIAIFARSVYLQGLLLVPEEGVPEQLAGVKPVRNRLEKSAKALGMSLPELALRFAASLEGVSGVVVGLETLEQLESNLAMLAKGNLAEETLEEVSAIVPDLPDEILLPNLWGTL